MNIIEPGLFKSDELIVINQVVQFEAKMFQLPLASYGSLTLYFRGSIPQGDLKITGNWQGTCVLQSFEEAGYPRFLQ
jgi:hypothetical protein